VYDTCKILPLKIFFEIAETGNVNLLSNEKKDKEELDEVWDKIIKEYAKLDQNNSIQDIIEKNDEMYNKAALFCEVKAMLLYLRGAESQEYVDRLNELGYKIDLKDRIKSIQLNDTKANHINTKMLFLQKDIEKHQTGKKQTFVGAMAWLSSNLGFEPSDDIVVLKYIEYKKIIVEKQKAKSKTRNYA
jgi:hypothetical protein